MLMRRICAELWHTCPADMVSEISAILICHLELLILPQKMGVLSTEIHSSACL